MLTTTQASALQELQVRAGQPLAAKHGIRNVVERAAWEVALDVAEAGAALPIDDPPRSNIVRWLHVPRHRVLAVPTETLESLTRRVDAGFVSAWNSGSYVTLARVALGKAQPAWGWAGRSMLIEALVARASHQVVERYEVVVSVPESPQSDTGARAFGLFDRLMHLVDTRCMLRLQFTQ